jgi:group I intron endonuclease
MSCGIYKITNKENGKSYIGLSVNIEARWSDHIKKMNSEEQYDKPLYRAFRKYGLSSFTFEILEECKSSELSIKEQYWIEELKTAYEDFGYNLTFGGYSGTFQKLNPVILDEIFLLLVEGKLQNNQIASLFNVSDQTISDINCGRSWYNSKYNYPIRPQKTPDNLCIDCGKKITKEPGIKRCQECASKALRKVKRPDPDTLIKEIKESSMLAVGKKYGVSDNAIRKWLKGYGLPTSTKKIKSM